MFKTVLFPIDNSPEAYEAVDFVVELVKFHQSKLILLSVVEERPSEEAQASPESPLMASADAIAQLLNQAKARFAEQGISAQTEERSGKPAFVICDVADELEVNLIIMGCRGMGLTEEGLQDSVTNRVINLAPCPVLIVP